MIFRSLVRLPGFILMIGMALCPALAMCQSLSAWRGFIAAPSYETYRQFNLPRKVRCDISPPSNSELNDVLELVSGGNSAAFQVLLDIRVCLDGGALEDFYRASGSYLEKQPHGFLALVSQYNVPKSELGYMLAMLPLNSVDQPRLRLKLIENRIDTLSMVRTHALDATFDMCRGILATEAKDYRRMLDESSR